MKWVALLAPALSMGPLLVTTPSGSPSILMWPTTVALP
jgi:hypothetical protein